MARWCLGAGILATIGANLAHGLGHGPIGALVSAWPALALAGSFELLMTLVRTESRASVAPACSVYANSPLREREQVLVAAWLTGLRSARTRRAYAADVAAWLGWLAGRDTGELAAGRVYVDRWAATQLGAGAVASSVRRRLRRCPRSTGTARPMT